VYDGASAWSVASVVSPHKLSHDAATNSTGTIGSSVSASKSPIVISSGDESLPSCMSHLYIPFVSDCRVTRSRRSAHTYQLRQRRRYTACSSARYIHPPLRYIAFTPVQVVIRAISSSVYQTPSSPSGRIRRKRKETLPHPETLSLSRLTFHLRVVLVESVWIAN
jgi:hypothetical protein